MVKQPRENELARRIAAQGWACRDNLSVVRIGGDGRRTWRVGTTNAAARSVDSGCQQLGTDPLGTELGVYVHGFDLAAQSFELLKVPEDHQLTHSDRFTGHFCYQLVITGDSLISARPAW